MEIGGMKKLYCGIILLPIFLALASPLYCQNPNLLETYLSHDSQAYESKRFVHVFTLWKVCCFF